MLSDSCGWEIARGTKKKVGKKEFCARKERCAKKNPFLCKILVFTYTDTIGHSFSSFFG